MVDTNRDVIAGRISLDTSKILPAFKVIDTGVLKNAESFKTLNKELLVSEKSYTSMARAMDKMALTSDERRKKILDESNALVAQRKAATELLNAKKNQLDETNKIVESRLQTQQSIQKKREDAIEQQAREHLKRMETLQNRATTSGAQASRATGAGSDAATRERVLQEEQSIRRRLAEMEERDHQIRLRNTQRESAARERALQEEQRIRREIDRQAAQNEERLRRANQSNASDSGQSSLLENIQRATVHATVFQGVYHAINIAQETLRESIIGIEYLMAGYIATNEKYFATHKEGSNQMVLDMQKVSSETTKFIQTTHELGSEIESVLESARLWGRMYKDVGIVQEMVRQSTQLSTVDLVQLEAATKGMESTIAQYGVQIKTVNDAQREGTRILDSWSKVAHDTMAPAKDIAQAFERTGKIASETGVSFDVMNGLISAGIRNTALGGANLGNMWKTVLGTIRTDKAVNEIERLGVATKTVVDGTEEWRKAEDILIDLSIVVTDKNYDLTKSYADISRGVFQFAKLAASLNIGDILLGTSASINSTGSTMKYLEIQMDTIERKAKQVKASLMELFNNAGDDGLRTQIKGALDVIDKFLIGMTHIPKEALQVTEAIAAMGLAYIAIGRPILLMNTAQAALIASTRVHAVVNTAATESMVIYNAAAMATARTTALLTGGLTLIAGAIAIYVMGLGNAEQAERKHSDELEREISNHERLASQYQRQAEFLVTVTNARDKLTVSLKNQNLTDDQRSNIAGQLDKVEQALTETVGAAGLARMKAAGFTKEAVKIEMDALSDRTAHERQETLKVINIDKSLTTSKIAEAKKRMKALELEMNVQKAKADAENPVMTEKGLDFYNSLPLVGPLIKKLTPENEKQKYKRMETDYEEQIRLSQESQKKLDELNAKTNDILNNSIQDFLTGADGKRTKAEQLTYEQRKVIFDEKMKNFNHNVNMEVQGYEDANGQLEKLKTIRANFNDMDANDLYSLDENIHRAEQGIEKKATGIADENPQKEVTPFDTTEGYKKRPFERVMKDLDGDLKASESVNQRYKETSQEYRDELQKQYEIHVKQRDLQKEEADRIRGENESIQTSLDLGGQTAEQRNKTLKQLEENKDTLADLGMKWWDYELAAEQSTKKLNEVVAKFSEDQFNNSKNWIAHKKAISEVSAREELKDWERVQAQYIEGTELRKQADEQVYALRKAAINEDMSLSEKWVAHEKAVGKLTPAQEIAAWERVQGRYLEGTEQRMRAEEQLYTLRKQSFDDDKKNIEEINKKELDALDKLVTSEKKYIDESKKAELDRIDAAKKAYVDAQDAKIKAIEALIAAEQEANTDSDYEKQLAEKQARAKLLENAVGPEGKKERKDLLVEITKMQEDHNRDLRKRDLESQKTALEAEKSNHEKAFDAQKKAAETHFQSLLDALDLYNNDAEGRAEALKQLQILKESEKNVEILKNLDTFISEYQAKMSRITPTSNDPSNSGGEKVYVPVKSKKELDLEEYNRNKDLWEQANVDGDKARMADYNRRNEEIRKKYGIPEDTDKLQKFKDGGIVNGLRGQAVPVVAHAGEMYINEAQQSSLFKLLNFSMPQMNFSMPQFEMPKTIVQQITQHFDMSADNVNLSDQADIKSFYKERGDIVGRSLTRSGVKLR